MLHLNRVFAKTWMILVNIVSEAKGHNNVSLDTISIHGQINFLIYASYVEVIYWQTCKTCLEDVIHRLVCWEYYKIKTTFWLCIITIVHEANGVSVRLIARCYRLISWHSWYTLTQIDNHPKARHVFEMEEITKCTFIIIDHTKQID